MCTVATIGPSATQQASSDRLGAAGSCTCSTSKPPSLTQRRTRPRTGSRTPAGPPSRCTAPGRPGRPAPRSPAAGCRRRPARSPRPRGPARSAPRPGPGCAAARRRARPRCTGRRCRLSRSAAPTGVRPRRVSRPGAPRGPPPRPAGPGRGRRRTPAAACASPPGARRCPPRRHPPAAWVIAATFSRLVPSAGTGISSWMCAPQPGPSNHSVTGSRAAPVCTASAAGPRPSSAPSRRRIPPRYRPPVTSRSETAGRPGRPARSRWARMPNRLAPPVAGSTSMPSPSRKARNRWNSDSGLSRSATVVNEPAPRLMIQSPACS